MNAYPDNNPKTAIGSKKPSLHALPPVALLHVGKAMADGERKYGLMNWRALPVSSLTYIDAMWRHMLAYQDGQNVAEDSGCHHLAHIAACCFILLDAEEQGCLKDNRSAPGRAADLIRQWSSQVDPATLQLTPGQSDLWDQVKAKVDEKAAEYNGERHVGASPALGAPYAIVDDPVARAADMIRDPAIRERELAASRECPASRHPCDHRCEPGQERCMEKTTSELLAAGRERVGGPEGTPGWVA